VVATSQTTENKLHKVEYKQKKLRHPSSNYYKE
jgi:hypothetical protein